MWINTNCYALGKSIEEKSKKPFERGTRFERKRLNIQTILLPGVYIVKILTLRHFLVSGFNSETTVIYLKPQEILTSISLISVYVLLQIKLHNQAHV